MEVSDEEGMLVAVVRQPGPAIGRRQKPKCRYVWIYVYSTDPIQKHY